MSFNKIVDRRPWGKFTQYAHNQEVTVKIIEVKPGQKLSVQKHRKRDELWVPLDRGLYARIGEETVEMLLEHEYYIPRKTIHSVENLSPIDSRFLEVSFGYFDEDDIERLEDIYGRS
jgi:mannose-1-phosphate guanylyltransferase/mannose-6-phosphate isomerase